MTVNLRIKEGYFYAVASFKQNGKYKQKWVALGLPVKNNKRKAESMLNEIKTNLIEQGYCDSDSVIEFVPYIEKWLKSVENTIEKSTWEGYRIYAEKHIIPYFAPMNLKVAEVKPKHIFDYYNFKYQSGRRDGKPGGLSIPSIQKHGIVLRNVFERARLDGLVETNPAAHIKMPARNTSEREPIFLTGEEANRLLKAFRGHPLEGLVYVTLYYGLRRSEALGLRWSAIDFERDTISINHTVVKNVTIVEKDKTKTDGSRCTYALIPDVKVVLQRIKEKQIQNQETFQSCYEYNDYVFKWDDGHKFRPDYVTRAFQRVVVQAGLPKMRFHDLRHSTSSILYDKGWDIRDTKTWMRHSSIEMTGDVYTHISKQRRERLVNDINSTFQLS